MTARLHGPIDLLVPHESYVVISPTTLAPAASVSPAAQAAELARLLHARNLLPNTRTSVVGLVLPGSLGQREQANHPNLYETVLGAAGVLKDHGLLPALLGQEALLDDAPDAPPHLDAVLTLSHVPGPIIETIRRQHHAAVWVDTALWLPHACLRRDEVAAGRLAAQAAVNAGYRRLVLIGLPLRPNQHYSLVGRREGIAEVTDAAGLEVELFECGGADGDDPSVLDALLELLTPETALIALDYYRLEWFLGQLLLTDRRPGRDFGIACCDGSHQAARFFGYIARTTFDRFALGRIAAEMAIHLMRNPDDPPLSHLATPDLIPGSTLPGPRGE